jgi:hypothetical protein
VPGKSGLQGHLILQFNSTNCCHRHHDHVPVDDRIQFVPPAVMSHHPHDFTQSDRHGANCQQAHLEVPAALVPVSTATCTTTHTPVAYKAAVGRPVGVGRVRVRVLHCQVFKGQR